MEPQTRIPAESIVPTASEARLALDSSDALARLLPQLSPDGATRLHLCGMDTGAEVEVPNTALRLMVDMLREMGRGNRVTVMSSDTELTTQQAADILRISRPYLVKLLERGILPYRKVGSHRRLLARDVYHYREQERRRREQVMEELVAETKRLGLYE